MPTGKYNRNPCSEETKKKIGIANTGINNGFYKHGYTGTPLHRRWIRIRYRVRTRAGYKHVSFCERWNNYENFKEDMEESYLEHVKNFGDKNTTIDRIDPNGDYSPDNCRWVGWKEQSINRRNNIFFNFFGEKMTIPDAARKYGLEVQTLYERIKRGWTIENAINKKSQRKKHD